MQTQLPRRPYIEQLPPPDGLGAVRREAVRRRRRRAVGVVTGGVTAAIVTAAALLVGGGAGGDAILRPAPAGPATITPTPGGVAVPPGKLTPRSPAAAPASDHSGGATADPVTVGAAPARHDPRVTAADSVTLTRTRSSYTGAPRVCRTGDAADNGTGVHPGANWCLAVTAVRLEGGVRLSLQVCRDSTTGGSLTFTGSREVDFVVKRAGTTIWSWSHAHPGSPSHHTLSAPADGCWNWTLVWPGVDQSGRAVGHGSYTLTSNSTAEELYAGPDETAAFQY